MKFKIGSRIYVGAFGAKRREFKLTKDGWIAIDGGSVPSFLADVEQMDFVDPGHLLKDSDHICN